MPSPKLVFSEGLPAAPQHLTKPTLSFPVPPPQNTPVKARRVPKQVYLLLGHSEGVLFVGSMAIYFGRLSSAWHATSATQHLAQVTPTHR